MNHFAHGQIALLSQDDYYIPVGQMTAEENRLHNFDLPECIDSIQFEQDVDRLLRGQTVYKKEYNFNNSEVEPRILEIKPAPVLIIEGLFIYHESGLRNLFDYRIFIDAKAEIALERRLNRDFIERGYSEEDVLYKWNHHVLPSYQEYLLPYRSLCDRIIDNSTNDLQYILDITQTIATELKENPKVIL